MRRNDHCGRGTFDREFLDDERIGDMVKPGAAILLGNEDAHHPQAPQLGDSFGGERVCAIGFDADRAQALAGEAARGIAGGTLRFVWFEVHQLSILSTGKHDRNSRIACQSRSPQVYWSAGAVIYAAIWARVSARTRAYPPPDLRSRRSARKPPARNAIRRPPPS